MLEKLKGKIAFRTNFLFPFFFRTWNKSFSRVYGRIWTKSTDLISCTIQKYRIKFSYWYLVSFLISDPKREPYFFTSAILALWQKRKKKHKWCATENWTTLQLPPFGWENRNVHRMTVNKVVASTSGKKKSPCPFHLEVRLARNQCPYRSYL